ncbi:alpha/beta hydrolase [Chloroflexota bacterium]
MNRWLKLGLALILVIIVAFIGISAYLGHSMTRVERIPVEGDPSQLGMEYEDVSFASMDKALTLRGWYIPIHDSSQIIIMVHGNDQNRADSSIKMLDIASGLVERGYNVLMFDLRGHGESDGDMTSAGYHEKKDLIGAVEYVKSHGFDSIGVLGFSLGASTAILAAAEDNDIDAVVADSCFADLKDMMEPEFSKRTKSPKFFLRPLLFMVKIMYGVDFNAIRPIEYVNEIAPRPILFIHGEKDETVPVEHAYRLYEASQNPENQLWVVPDAGHVGSYVLHPEQYIDNITAFFGTALKPR